EAALTAAIEIYNKPSFPYREESFAILAINAWELLLKAKVMAENGGDRGSLYEYEYRTTARNTQSKKRHVKRNRAGNGSVPAHASQEQRIQLACFFCPHVVDIRSQYYYCDDEMDQRILNGYIPVRNKLPTLDLMLTITRQALQRLLFFRRPTQRSLP
ncbi:DUF3644 domain-containing protein, partial [Ralstonia solanacearum]|uniref:DUF3644 domain-containing protein n=1 Tax=Ralstonia solanacearum TaxID=305 RepID=UPI001E5B3639